MGASVDTASGATDRDSTAEASRRKFISWLAASPFFIAQVQAQGIPYLVTGLSAADVWNALDDRLIASPEEALSLFDFEKVAAHNLPPAHFGYLAGAAGESGNMRQVNLDAIEAVRIRMSRLHGEGRPDTAVMLFGKEYSAPFFQAPVSSLKAFHPEGELAVARAARSHGIPMAISTFTSTAIEQVNEAYGAPVWFQLYTQSTWEATVELVQRAEQSGSNVLLFTVDSPARTASPIATLFERADDRDCTLCHNDTMGQRQHKPMTAPLSAAGMPQESGPNLDWTYIDRLRGITDMQIVVKGIETRADAEAARAVGVDGLYVSNHGGRVMHAGRGALECLPEVVEGAGELPVLIDSGFRRGSDVFKALALGASAVGFGRPFCWGIAAFGEAGADRAMQMVTDELATTMIHAGAGTIERITRAMLA